MAEKILDRDKGTYIAEGWREYLDIRFAHIKEVVDLRIKNVEDKIDAQDKLSSQHFELNQKAISKAEENMVSKLEGMNEWRGQSKDRESTFVTRNEFQSTQKIVYIGIGIMIALEFLFKLILK